MESTTVSDLLPPEPTAEEAGGEETLIYISQARDRFTEAVGYLAEEDWNLYKDKNDVKLLTKKSVDGGVDLVLREAIIEKPQEVVYEWFCNQSNLVDNSERLIVSEVVDELGPESFLLKREVKGNFLVSNRDMCIFWHKLNLTDGSVANIQFSIMHSKIPETKCVRGELNISLLMVTKIDDNKCKLISLGKIDPKGSIPTSFVNKMTWTQFDELVKMKKVIEAL
ncbi:unnamed protein product [Moneuplotes crassus]|uniref:START domain-containing protein n=1 Tax=Euplotes crassus TaxID=5936 RepID=A0AAD2CY02_EUPCR|nr:unnamed protein product [Moneuplotes crassus]